MTGWIHCTSSLKVCVLILWLFVMASGQTVDGSSLVQTISYGQRLNNGNLNETKINLKSPGNAVLNSLLKTNVLDKLIKQTEKMLNDDFEAIVNSSYDVTSSCWNDTIMVLWGIVQGEKWALQVLDAMGKPPPDISTSLKFRWPGSYRECLAIRAPISKFSNDDRSTFKGQYCSVGIKLANATADLEHGVQIELGLCVPTSCSDKDIAALIDTGHIALPLTTVDPEPRVWCEPDHSVFDISAIVAIVVCSVFAVVMLSGTLYDVAVRLRVTTGEKYKLEENESKHDVKRKSETDTGILGKILLSFSVYTNGAKILNTSQPAGALTAVNGIRFLSMSWVILGHTYSILRLAVDNMAFDPKMMERFSFQAIANGTLSVDSFFVLSGLLVSYLGLKQMKKAGGVKKFGWGLFYFHRFWRLTPAYMLVMVVYMGLYKYLSSGPLWNMQYVDIGYCQDVWWRNILYVNNLFSDSKFCMGWSWYLSNDMQFYVISPLILIPLYYSSLIGGLVCMSMLIACVVSAGVISANNDFPPNIVYAHNPELMIELYVRPYTRIGPYIVGFVAGYLLYKTNSKLHIPKMLNVLGWSVCTGVALTLLYGLYNLDGPNTSNHLGTEVSAAYNALSRSTWGMTVAWVIVACATGNGGFVNTLLSWRAFVPLGRLTYCAYLVHPIVLFVYYQSKETMIYADDNTLIYIYLGHLCVSYGAAFCISLAFESPMMGLEKALLQRGKNS